MNPQPSWQLLTTDENGRIWQRVAALLHFPAPAGTELTYPAGSRLYDIGSIYEGEAVYREGTGDEDIVWRTRHYRDSEDDLNEKVLLALRENTAPSEFVYALNWQHNGYKLFPTSSPPTRTPITGECPSCLTAIILCLLPQTWSSGYSAIPGKTRSVSGARRSPVVLPRKRPRC